MTRQFVLVAGLALIACAGAPREVRSSTAAEQSASAERPLAEKGNANADVICEMETPVGSRIRHRVCRKREDVERERMDAQEALRPRSGSPAPKGGGG